MDENRKSEMLGAFAKGALGAIPYLGPIVAEVVGVLIPNRRVERIESLLVCLNKKLEDAGTLPNEGELKTPEAVDILEDGFYQAARALSRERISFIASALKQGLTSKVIRHADAKVLLRLLEQISDLEVVILASYSQAHMMDQSFQDKHVAALVGPRATLATERDAVDRAALYATHRNHLEQLGLLRRRFESPRSGQLPQFDERSGRIKSSGWAVTGLGELLLRVIEFDEGHEAPTGTPMTE